MPMQSPQGYVKLPRIPSVKYIPIWFYTLNISEKWMIIHNTYLS